MSYEVEVKGMQLNEESRETTNESTARILQVYSEKLRKLKEEENDG